MTTTTTRPTPRTATPNAAVIGRAIFEAIEARTGVTWDGVPEPFRKVYTGYGSRVEAALYAHRIVPGAPARMVPPRLAVEIEEWRTWWKSGRAENNRRTRTAAQILADLADSLR